MSEPSSDEIEAGRLALLNDTHWFDEDHFAEQCANDSAVVARAIVPLVEARIRAELDPFLCNSCRHRLADGPVQSLDQPSIAGQANLLSSGVDALGEIVGES